LWNDFMSPLLYISDSSKWTLQMFVRQVTISSDPSTTLGNLDPNYVPPKEGLKFAVIVIATLPIMLVYPFLQKHFAKGGDDRLREGLIPPSRSAVRRSSSLPKRSRHAADHPLTLPTGPSFATAAPARRPAARAADRPH